MVPRRACAAERGALASRQARRGTGRRVGACYGCRPGARCKRRAVVHGVQPQLGNEIVGLYIRAQCAYRPYRRKRLHTVLPFTQRQPLLPRRSQKSQVARRMDLCQYLRAIHIRGVQYMTPRSQSGFYIGRARRVLETRYTLAAEKFVLGSVGVLQRVMEGDHRRRPSQSRLPDCHRRRQSPTTSAPRKNPLRPYGLQGVRIGG